ncbi:MAG: hypothetical protein IJ971_08185 [Bacteroidales bacterium]|nr:hypothetical protein [Bacteroidales bacterium]
MKKIKGIIIALAAGMLVLSSCMKDETELRYNNATMGNVVDGRFISDQGNIFNVVEQNCKGQLDTMKRAFVVCDVIKATEAGSQEYDVRLNYLSSVLTKDAIPSSEVSDPSAAKNDPLLLTDLWVSGGYVNLYITVPVARTDNKIHTINFIYDEPEQKDGTYTFVIRHDAAGEILSETSDNSNLVLAGAYASFPVSSIIKEDSAKIKIVWNSYVVVGENAVSAKTAEYSIERKYNKSDYEHVPSTATASKSMTEIR